MNTIVELKIRGVGPPPSFKNRKRAGVNRETGKLMSYTEPKIKERMARIESAIVFALYSASQTGSGATDSECRKRLQTALSGLSDDSILEIPEFSFGVVRCPQGEEGVDILIDEIL